MIHWIKIINFYNSCCYGYKTLDVSKLKCGYQTKAPRDKSPSGQKPLETKVPQSAPRDKSPSRQKPPRQKPLETKAPGQNPLETKLKLRKSYIVMILYDKTSSMDFQSSFESNKKYM